MQKSDLKDGMVVRLTNKRSGETCMAPVVIDGDWIEAGMAHEWTLWSPAIARYHKGSGWNTNWAIEVVSERESAPREG